MKSKALAVALLLVATAASAADVDGNWTTNIETPNGPIEIKYTFKSEGTLLTGTSTGPDGNPIPIRNGKIEGDQISFSLELRFGPEPTTFTYTGTVSPTEIHLNSEFMGQPVAFTLKKVT